MMGRSGRPCDDTRSTAAVKAVASLWFARAPTTFCCERGRGPLLAASSAMPSVSPVALPVMRVCQCTHGIFTAFSLPWHFHPAHDFVHFMPRICLNGSCSITYGFTKRRAARAADALTPAPPAAAWCPPPRRRRCTRGCSAAAAAAPALAASEHTPQPAPRAPAGLAGPRAACRSRRSWRGAWGEGCASPCKLAVGEFLHLSVAAGAAAATLLVHTHACKAHREAAKRLLSNCGPPPTHPRVAVPAAPAWISDAAARFSTALTPDIAAAAEPWKTICGLCMFRGGGRHF